MAHSIMGMFATLIYDTEHFNTMSWVPSCWVALGIIPLSIECHHAEWHYAVCRISYIVIVCKKWKLNFKNMFFKFVIFYNCNIHKLMKIWKAQVLTLMYDRSINNLKRWNSWGNYKISLSRHFRFKVKLKLYLYHQCQLKWLYLRYVL